MLLAPLLGTAVAERRCSRSPCCARGQSSTLTGTLAGQIVMEGFLNFRMRPWLRRLITRSLAIIPAALTIYFAGDAGTYQLLILSQVILSMQLPFAVIPLIHFTSDRRRMGEFANRLWVTVLAWITAAIIVALNVWLLVAGRCRMDWRGGQLSPACRSWCLQSPVCFWRACCSGLRRAAARPLGRALRARARHVAGLPRRRPLEAPVYQRILVPLDHTALDRPAIAHAAAMARMHHAKLYLLHVEEGVTSQVYGSLSSTAEVEAGQKYLDDIVASLRAEGIEVETMVAHSSNPNREIVRARERIQPDLLIMGAHGHGGLKDLIFGTTINSVRHKLRIPLLVVRGVPK